ncbi:MFS transporter [Rothia nasisuis]|nr:MFS transporter [Rothia nasisuis]
MKQHQGANIPLTHIIIYLCAMSINGFDGTVVVPVLPLMAATFKVTPADLSGVEWAFLIASAAVLPLAGWLGARLGAARVFRIFLAGLGIGLLLSGIANSVWMLLAGRIIQGVSSGVLVPVGLAMMYRNATGADRLRISRLTLIPLTIAPMLGPVLGGIMAQHMGWRSIFTLLAAFSMGVFLAACFCMKPEAPDQTATALKIDRVGLVLVLISTVGLALLPVAIANATSRASSPLTYLALTVLTLLAGALMFYSWKRAQKRPYPALAVGAFTSRMFRSATVSVGISFAALTGFLFFVPVLLAARGIDTQTIGLMMFPETLGLLVGGQLMIPLKKFLGTRKLMILGYVGAALITVIIAHLPHPGLVFALAMFCFSLFLSQPVLIAQAAAFLDIPPDSMDESTTLFMMIKTILSAWGVVLVSVVITWHHLPSTTGVWLVSLLLLTLWCFSLALTAKVPASLWDGATSETA